MSYKELYEPYRQEVEERYPLVMERIAEIPAEETVEPPFRDYFQQVALLVMRMHKIERGIAAGTYYEKPLKELKEQNRKNYEDILPEHYKESYANPDYAVKTLGEDYGKLLSMLYAEILR